jgi:hypothetical protein
MRTGDDDENDADQGTGEDEGLPRDTRKRSALRSPTEFAIA